MKFDKSSTDQLITSLAEGDLTVLDELYDLHRDDFLLWSGSRFKGVPRDLRLEAWHDSMILFYEEIQDQKGLHRYPDLKNHLFLIAYRRMAALYGRNERKDFVGDFDVRFHLQENKHVVEWEEADRESQNLLRESVGDLPEQSRKILVQRFVEGRPVEEIMQAMGSTSVNAFSVTLSRALIRLKEIIVERTAHQQAWKKETRS